MYRVMFLPFNMLNVFIFVFVLKVLFHYGEYRISNKQTPISNGGDRHIRLKLQFYFIPSPPLPSPVAVHFVNKRWTFTIEFVFDFSFLVNVSNVIQCCRQTTDPFRLNFSVDNEHSLFTCPDFELKFIQGHAHAFLWSINFSLSSKA